VIANRESQILLSYNVDMSHDSRRAAAQGVTWDLSDLYTGIDDPRINADLATALSDAEAFAARWRGKIDAALTAAGLAGAMAEQEALLDRAYRAACYAQLVFAADTADAKIGALMQRVQEQTTTIGTRLIFFDLAIIELPDAPAERLLADPLLARYAHHLRNIRKYKPHRMSEGEETILAELDNTGASAWQRLFDETLGALRCQVALPEGTVERNEEETLALLHDPERARRKAGADALTASLRANQRLLTYVFNTLTQDHAVHDRLRNYPEPMAARHLANEIRPATVAALLDACDRHNPTVQRYYRTKAKLLGLADFADYDRYAPLSVAEGDVVPFAAARDTVLGAYHAFSPRMAAIAREFFDKRWIDAEVRDGKRGGAFSHGMVPSTHPYVFANYTGQRRDVMTLAHELGHGVHQYLAREQGLFHADTPLTMAETASVFGEMLVFQQLLRDTPAKEARLALLCGKLEDSFATVFRQACMTRFEQALHAARRAEGELAPERIHALWLAANRAMFGDSVHLRDDYALWWMYIPHFVHTPFYCYAYAFGELLVLALYRRYEEEGAAFVPKYLALLRSGGSAAPETLLGRIGIDVNDPTFWDGGLELLKRMVEQVEELAG
jgi:oligoendopeptidase F